MNQQIMQCILIDDNAVVSHSEVHPILKRRNASWPKPVLVRTL